MVYEFIKVMYDEDKDNERGDCFYCSGGPEISYFHFDAPNDKMHCYKEVIKAIPKEEYIKALLRGNQAALRLRKLGLMNEDI